MMLQEVNNDTYASMESDIFAKTVYGEGRNRDVHFKIAIANVVLNRVVYSMSNGGHWWGNNIVQVCQKPYQFQCWNRSMPEYTDLMRVDEDIHGYQQASEVVHVALAEDLKDTIYGATHYHNANEKPYWTQGETPVAQVDTCLFYKLI